MSKLLIALLALDIGVSLSKVYIFSWQSNYLAKNNNFLKIINKIWIINCILFYKVNN